MDTFEQILTESIPKYLGDSGGAYGYIYERNRENGITKGVQKCDFYRDDDNKECELYPIVPVYDFLEYNCIETYQSQVIQDMIEERLKLEQINIYSIWEIQDIMQEMFHNTFIGDMEWTYTYNYDNILSQDIQFLLFEYDGLDYVLLQVHNGCDARSGLTAPKVFELNDIEYFLMGVHECDIYCDCNKFNLTYYGYNELCDYNGSYIDNQYIYENTYVDNEGNLRCKHCNELIKCAFMEY